MGERMRFFLVALFLMNAPPSLAGCHIYKSWHYPWPQRCYSPVRIIKPVYYPPPKDDRWSVIITQMPAFTEDTARQEGIAKLREKLNGK
jgi:hypothetical protein